MVTLEAGSQRVHLEHQWDLTRGEITLVATKGQDRTFGDHYAVTRPATNQDEANQAWRAWIGLYREALGLKGDPQ
jgi:hypothetical protein